MTAANPASPAPASSRPAGAAGGAPRGMRPPPPTIDPVRVLRQHAWLLVGAAVVGAVLGTIANFVCLYAYPLWGGSVVFEIRPQVQSAKEAVTVEAMGDEGIARLAQTESQRILTKQILETAMAAPTSRTRPGARSIRRSTSGSRNCRKTCGSAIARRRSCSPCRGAPTSAATSRWC